MTMTDETPSAEAPPVQTVAPRPARSFGMAANDFGVGLLDSARTAIGHRYAITFYALLICAGVIGAGARIPITREGGEIVWSAAKQFGNGVVNVLN